MTLHKSWFSSQTITCFISCFFFFYQLLVPIPLPWAVLWYFLTKRNQTEIPIHITCDGNELALLPPKDDDKLPVGTINSHQYTLILRWTRTGSTMCDLPLFSLFRSNQAQSYWESLAGTSDYMYITVKGVLQINLQQCFHTSRIHFCYIAFLNQIHTKLISVYCHLSYLCCCGFKWNWHWLSHLAKLLRTMPEHNCVLSQVPHSPALILICVQPNLSTVTSCVIHCR